MLGESFRALPEDSSAVTGANSSTHITTPEDLPAQQDVEVQVRDPNNPNHGQPIIFVY